MMKHSLTIIVLGVIWYLLVGLNVIIRGHKARTKDKKAIRDYKAR